MKGQIQHMQICPEDFFKQPWNIGTEFQPANEYTAGYAFGKEKPVTERGYPGTGYNSQGYMKAVKFS